MQHPLLIEEIFSLPGSFENVVQTLDALSLEDQHMRDINGALIVPQKNFHKYRLSLKGQGKYLPCFGNVYVGQKLHVSLSHVFWQHSLDKQVTLARDIVKGSVNAVNKKGVPVRVESQQENHLTFLAIPEGGVYISYRPLLKMQLMTLQMNIGGLKEAANEWRLVLEEI